MTATAAAARAEFMNDLVAGRAGGRCECLGGCGDHRCLGGRCLERHTRRSVVGGRGQKVAVLQAVRDGDDWVVLCQFCVAAREKEHAKAGRP